VNKDVNINDHSSWRGQNINSCVPCSNQYSYLYRENCSEHYGHEGPRELELCFTQLRHASNGIIARPDSAGELPPMPADCRRFDNAIMDQMSTINDNRHWQIHVESLTGGINRQECHSFLININRVSAPALERDRRCYQTELFMVRPFNCIDRRYTPTSLKIAYEYRSKTCELYQNRLRTDPKLTNRTKMASAEAEGA